MSAKNILTLGRDTSDEDHILRVIYAISCKLGCRLRRAAFAGRTVTLRFRFSDYKLYTCSLTTSHGLSLDREIYNVAKFVWHHDRSTDE